VIPGGEEVRWGTEEKQGSGSEGRGSELLVRAEGMIWGLDN
jgi:hypothetical protein